MSNKKHPLAYGVSSGPVIITLNISNLLFITRQKQLLPYSTGSAFLYAANSLNKRRVLSAVGAAGVFFKK